MKDLGGLQGFRGAGAGTGLLPCPGSLPSSVSRGTEEIVAVALPGPERLDSGTPKARRAFPAPHTAPGLPQHGWGCSCPEFHGGRGGCWGWGAPKAEAVRGCVTGAVWGTPQFLLRTARGAQDHPSPTAWRERGFLWSGVDLDPAWWMGKCQGMASIPGAHPCSALLWVLTDSWGAASHPWALPGRVGDGTNLGQPQGSALGGSCCVQAFLLSRVTAPWQGYGIS